MDEVALPIDPLECELIVARESAAHVKLNVKVPARLVRRFRKKMRRAGLSVESNELSTALVQFCVTEVLKRDNLRMVSPPGLVDGSPELRVSTERDFVCTLGIDVAVPITLPDLSGVTLRLPDLPVTEEMVTEEVKAQCRQFGDRSPAETAERGSECVIDIAFRVLETEPAVVNMEKETVQIPDEGDMLLVQTLQVPGVAAALRGARVGDTRTAHAHFPTNFAVRLLRATPAFVSVVIREIRQVKPAAVESVLKGYGMPNEARLRTQIRFALEDKRTRDSQAILREQLASRLPEIVPVDLPLMRVRLLRTVAERQLLAVLKARGLSEELTKSEFERAKPDLQSRAEKQARLQLILQSLAHQLGLMMDEDVVAGRIAALAAERGVRPETLRAEMVKTGAYKEFIEEFGTELALDKLLRTVKVTTIPAAEWEANEGAKI